MPWEEDVRFGELFSDDLKLGFDWTFVDDEGIVVSDLFWISGILISDGAVDGCVVTSPIWLL